MIILNLRARHWFQQNIGDVAENFIVSVFFDAFQLFPAFAAAECLPIGLLFFLIFEGQHVCQIGNFSADQRFAEKDGMQAGFTENINLANVKHFNFRLAGLDAGAFIDAQLKDALSVGGDGRLKRGHAFKRDIKSAFDARIGRSSFRRV